MENSGILYIVSTPIGNLDDITLRALKVLKDVHIVAAEDTRRTAVLLNHFSIKKKLFSYHDHNKRTSSKRLIRHLTEGKDVALVTDAGTPGISDPAYVIVKESIERGINISPVPGATAAIAALSISGLPTDRFIFEGFLPAKKGRLSRLKAISQESGTLVFYESPHRLLKTLKDLLNVLGERNIAVCREITKKFEEVVRGSLTEVIELFSNRNIKGEFVLIVKGYNQKG